MTKVHRADLDGLRGVAILLVVVFHVWVGRVSGGVDAFLVLSGFFLVPSLVRAASAGELRVRAVAVRSARRLLPALLAVLGGVVLAAVVLLPEGRWGVVAEQTLASATYTQNWWLASRAQDYVAAGAAVSPLQHLWSMAVQGQVIVALTLLVAAVGWLLGRRLRTSVPSLVTGVLAAVALLSFGWAAWRSGSDPAFTYYDTVARLWEILVGGLLGLGAGRLAVPARLRAVLGWAGVLLLVGCGLVVDGAVAFPGPAALLPVLATAAVVVSVPAGVAVPVAVDGHSLTRVLASRPATWVGARAYALYLWHWPVLILLLASTGRDSAGVVDGVLIIVASLVLAELTHRLVEQPLRQRRSRPQAPTHPVTRRRRAPALVAVLVVTGLVVATPTGWLLHLQQREQDFLASVVSDPQRYPGALSLTAGRPTPDHPVRPELTDLGFTYHPTTNDGCVVDYDDPEVTACTYGDPEAERQIALVGGSHSEHWLTALDELGRLRGFQVVTYLKVACALSAGPDRPMSRGEVYTECEDWQDEVQERLAAEPPEYVFLTSTRPSATGDDRGPGDTAGWGDEVPPSYVAVWEELAAAGLEVLAVRDTPWLTEVTDQCLAETSVAECSNDREVVLDAVDPAQAYAEEFPSMSFLDLSDAVCGPQRCSAVQGNIVVYRDGNHITTTYGVTMAPALGAQLGPATGWW